MRRLSQPDGWRAGALIAVPAGDVTRQTVQVVATIVGRRNAASNARAQFAVADDGFYFTNPEGLNRYSFARQRLEHLFDLPGPHYFGLSVSPDGQNVLFTQRRPHESDIMLVEGFR